MNLEESYDESEEIVKAELYTKGQKKLPKIAIVCFKKELIDYIEISKEFEEYSEIYILGEKIKIYKTTVKGKDIIIYRTLIGGPATVAMMEELHARGVNKFIIFGSCGQLTSDLPKGAYIIPEEAYRDEGTSFHYMPASQFLQIETAKKLASIFEKNNISYVLTKTWTTDAIYRETVQQVKNKERYGCKVVEMECASIMAFARFRNIEAYQFLYTDDTLADEEWEIRTLSDDRTYILKKCLNIALSITDDI